jgi:hypothetical protein
VLGLTLAVLTAATGARAQDAAPRILVDSIHAHNAFQLEPGASPYSYHYAYGYRRGFDYLRERGVQVDEATSGRIDAAALDGHKLLFINLVSADLPPFMVDEIRAIKSFVENGGSLFIITDHSNCYYHAYKLMPLMEELGIQVTTETACDKAPFARGAGNGWITITSFVPHPVTAGLQAIGTQTGGTVDDRFAIARTSGLGWGDQWGYSPYGEKGNAGNYGNWKQDPGERTGPLGVLLAKELGKGRIFVASDQNMFGDPFLNYADNYKLWLNAASWLLDRKELSDANAYQTWRGGRILAYEDYEHSNFGVDDASGYFNLFGALGRTRWVFATNDLSGPADLILFAYDTPHLSEANLTKLVGHLKAGRNVVILGKVSAPPPGPEPLLAQLTKQLGTPTEETGQGGSSALSWPGTGQILILGDPYKFNNGKIPPPERTPTDEQAKVLAGLDQLVEGMM